MQKIFLLIIAIIFTASLQAQTVYIQKGKKKFKLYNEREIGLTTTSDTIKYGDGKNLSFTIAAVDSNSLTVRRPVKYADTTVEYADEMYHSLPFEFQVGKFFKKDKKLYVRLIRLIEFETRTYPLNEITTITYPSYGANEDGCIGCFFVPGLNVWYIISIIDKAKPKKRDMSVWKFTFD